MNPGPSSDSADASFLAGVPALIHRYRYGLAALSVVGIFALSSVPFHDPPRFRGWDKQLHVVEFFLVGLVILNGMTAGFRRRSWLSLGGAWAILIVLSILNEVYQRWIPGRSGDWNDMLASSLGGSVAVLLGAIVMAIGALRSRRSSREGPPSIPP